MKTKTAVNVPINKAASIDTRFLNTLSSRLD